MKCSECGMLDQLFTWRASEDSPLKHFNATRLVERAPALAERVVIDVDADQAQFILRCRGIELPRLAQLTPVDLTVPIIMLMLEGGDHLTVDGHHRYVRAWQLGWQVLPAYIYAYGTWDFALVTDMPALPAEVFLT